MAVGGFVFRVTEPTCKNVGGAPGDKRAVAGHKGIRAPRTGSRRAKVELIRDFERIFGRFDDFRSVTISWDNGNSRLLVSIKARKVEKDMLSFAEFVVVEALDELPEPPYGYRVLAIPTRRTP